MQIDGDVLRELVAVGNRIHCRLVDKNRETLLLSTTECEPSSSRTIARGYPEWLTHLTLPSAANSGRPNPRPPFTTVHHPSISWLVFAMVSRVCPLYGRCVLLYHCCASAVLCPASASRIRRTGTQYAWPRSAVRQPDTGGSCGHNPSI
jgi:hypothetical protein